jgi:PAS domain S-box-containing protein
MGPVRTRGSSQALPLALFVLLAIGLAIAAMSLQRSMRAGARHRAAAELESVAALKASAVASWRAEQLDVAEYAATYPFMRTLVAAASGAPDPSLRDHGGGILNHLASHHAYRELGLFRVDGTPFLPTGSGPGADGLAVIARTVETGATASRLSSNGGIHLDAAVPLRADSGAVAAVLLLSADATAELDELVRSWPVPSATAETFVLERTGGDVRVIAAAGGVSAAPAAPIEAQPAAVRAARGDASVLEATDDDPPVLAVMRPIPDSGWKVVATMHLAEVDAPLLRPARVIGALVLALLAACASALGLWWRKAREAEKAAAGRLSIEAELRESQERLQLALASTHAVWDWDLEGQRLRIDGEHAQRVGAESGGFEGDVPSILARIVHPDDRPAVLRRVEAHLRGETPVLESEHRVLTPTGEVRWSSVSGRASRRDGSGQALRMTGVLFDVTEQRRLQAQLEASERMASLGTLAAGVAHEINNPLAYVLANLDFLEGSLRPVAAREPEVSEALAHAREGADRVREVVRGLRAFSRPERAGRTRADLAAELDAAVRLAGNELRHRARLDVRVGALPGVAAGGHELGQVFLNLLVNAAHAIPEGRAGENRIEVEAGTDVAGWARIEVRDTGTGISPEVLPHIFEPFFTTKAQGVGTGLGLAICHGIVSAAGGRIEVESRVGRGSTFRVLLPAAPAAPDAAELTPDAAPSEAARAPAEVPRAPAAPWTPVAPAQPPAAPVQASAAPSTPSTFAAPVPAAGPARPPPGLGRRLRVLVVDDDPLVARAVTRILASANEVTVASSPADALARITAGQSFDAIVCDLMMPDMSGMDLHDRIAGLAPEVARRMIFVTGGAFSDRAREFLDRSPNPRLEKPFEAAVLRDAVASVARPLDSRA